MDLASHLWTNTIVTMTHAAQYKEVVLNKNTNLLNENELLPIKPSLVELQDTVSQRKFCSVANSAMKGM